MGTADKAILTVKVYPTHFLQTAPSVQLSVAHYNNPAGVWYDFMSNQFDITYTVVFPVRPVPVTGYYRDEKEEEEEEEEEILFNKE